MSQNPFQSPNVTTVKEAQFSGGFGDENGSQNQYQYRSLGTLAALITVLVGLTCGCHILTSSLDTFGYVTYPSFSDPNAVVSSDAEMSLIHIMMGVGIINIPVYLAAAILTCMYFYRANANLRSRNVRGLKFTPGWCAGWWFVPIMSLFKPFQAVSEIHQHSVPKSSTSLGIWWGAWIIGNILGQLEMRLALSGVDTGQGGIILTWAATLVTLVAGLLLIFMVREINKGQSQGVTFSLPN